MFKKLPVELQEKILWNVLSDGYGFIGIEFLNEDLIEYVYKHKKYLDVFESGLHKRFHRGHWDCEQCELCEESCTEDWCKINRSTIPTVSVTD